MVKLKDVVKLNGTINWKYNLVLRELQENLKY